MTATFTRIEEAIAVRLMGLSTTCVVQKVPARFRVYDDISDYINWMVTGVTPNIQLQQSRYEIAFEIFTEDRGVMHILIDNVSQLMFGFQFMGAFDFAPLSINLAPWNDRWLCQATTYLTLPIKFNHVIQPVVPLTIDTIPVMIVLKPREG